MRASAYLLYEEIADSIDYLAFINNFSLPDTFYSWFVVTELHIWMLSVRAMAEEDGRHIRNFLVEALWLDVAQRTKKLGAANPAAMRTSISELSEQLQAALIAYDEGLQTDDMVLASALWRRFYQFEGVDLDHLEKLVKYVRKQITLLDSTSSDKLLKEGTVGWKPLGE
ncbi:hypothetical protein NQ318_016899 [Aromia moschata]|uniref:Ubiquinol-cytochrome c chaperone domain-containing protein n=1 Tax=Aromia moschata TaxID=1265417 RepID=A0AAV8XS20_9CUCU|nr:hypothetical protein NQ318_016899 [Aromia moschata]